MVTVIYLIRDTIFKDITSGSAGAGFYFDITSQNISVWRTNFINCVTTSGSGGGGFFANVKAVEAICCNFERCKAPDNGCAFHILPACQNTTFLLTLFTKQSDFNQDGFYRSGSYYDIIQDSNGTECNGGSYIFTFGSSSTATVYYKFFNAVNSGATASGLFYSTSKIYFISSNIINCKGNYFIDFYASAGSLFSLTYSVISDSDFGTSLSAGSQPSLQVNNNVYSSISLMEIFGKDSGRVQTNPNTLIFKIPRCYLITYNECSLCRRSKSLVILYAVNLCCCYKILPKIIFKLTLLISYHLSSQFITFLRSFIL